MGHIPRSRLIRPYPTCDAAGWSENSFRVGDQNTYNRLKCCLRCAELFEITLRVRLKTPGCELRRVIDSRP
jgi:hypothetical protein